MNTFDKKAGGIDMWRFTIHREKIGALCWVVMMVLPVCAQYPDRELTDFSYQQCSAIREIIFSAHEKQFNNLMDREMKGSHGYQVRGSWRFETVQYESILIWPGATKSYIDNSEENTDSSHKIIRQYVAEFSGLKTLEDAKNKFELLNNQVAECRLFLSDTNITVLRPLPLSKIQDELPVAALDAKLFPVKVKDADAAQPGQEVVIMTAYERVGKLFSAYMIVEYRLVKE